MNSLGSLLEESCPVLTVICTVFGTLKAVRVAEALGNLYLLVVPSRSQIQKGRWKAGVQGSVERADLVIVIKCTLVLRSEIIGVSCKKE